MNNEHLPNNNEQDPALAARLKLAGAVMQVAEAGGQEALQAYFTDVLADSECNVPADEKVAVYDFLASRQTERLYGRLKQPALDYLKDTGYKTTEASHFAAKNSLKLSRGVADFDSGHRIIGKTLEKTQDYRRLVGQHDALTSDLSFMQTSGIAQAENLSSWARKVFNDSEHYLDKANPVQRHDIALRKGAEAVREVTSEDNVDFNSLIKDDVRKDATKLLVDAVDAVRSGELRLEDLVELLGPVDNRKARAYFGSLQTFAKEVSGQVLQQSKRTHGDADELSKAVLTYRNKGLNDYPRAKNVADAEDTYRGLHKVAQEVASRANAFGANSSRILDYVLENSRDHLQRIQSL